MQAKGRQTEKLNLFGYTNIAEINWNCRLTHGSRPRFHIDFYEAKLIIPLFAFRAFPDSLPPELSLVRESLPSGRKCAQKSYLQDVSSIFVLALRFATTSCSKPTATGAYFNSNYSKTCDARLRLGRWHAYQAKNCSDDFFCRCTHRRHSRF